jgi:hypothetical protein
METNDIETIAVPSQSLAFFLDLSPFTYELQLAREGVDDLRESPCENVKLNVGAQFMSPWDSPKRTAKFYPLLRIVLSAIYNVCKIHFGSDLLALNFKLRAFQCWCAVYEEGDETTFHNHFPCDFSAIVYLHMDQEAAPIVLENQVEVHLKTGSLLFFQGHVNHHVPKTVGRRSVLVANFYKLPVTVPMYQDPFLQE